MSGWTPWRRGTNRLPGTLCDETPGSPIKPVPSGWQPRDDSDHAMPSAILEVPAELAPGDFARMARAFQNAVGEWGTPVTDRVQHEIAQFLLERDTETQRADRAEVRLRDALERIRGLELTVEVLGQGAPLRVADAELLIQPLPATPRPSKGDVA